MRIFYALGRDFVAGGQLNSLAHILTLRALGRDARLLVLPPKGANSAAPVFPPGVEGPPWQVGVDGLAADDVVVVGEMFGAAAVALRDSPARRVLHNQNPFYTFEAFRDVSAIKGWNCERIICASGYISDFLRGAGWDGPTSVVRPFVDPVFAEEVGRPRQAAVAFMPRKRPREAKLIRGLVLSRRPDLASVPWVSLENVTRAECAHVLKRAALFLSLGHQEGLGLPPLEAMACGAIVVGFHGGGGLEYATADNGLWFGDDDPGAVADAVVATLDAFASGERFEPLLEAGRATAAAFSREAFETQLKDAWQAIAPTDGP